MTYGHLQADCPYTGISSGPNARYRVREAFTFTFFHTTRGVDGQSMRPVNTAAVIVVNTGRVDGS